MRYSMRHDFYPAFANRKELDTTELFDFIKRQLMTEFRTPFSNEWYDSCARAHDPKVE